jgi:predicted transcriptional regulator
MMEIELSEEKKEEILKLISTPGVEVEDIVKKVNLDYDTIMNFLSEEYLKHDLDYGRRICCRF